MKYKSHKELVTLLRGGTPDEFREGMRRHLENHFARILAHNHTFNQEKTIFPD